MRLRNLSIQFSLKYLSSSTFCTVLQFRFYFSVISIVISNGLHWTFMVHFLVQCVCFTQWHLFVAFLFFDDTWAFPVLNYRVVVNTWVISNFFFLHSWPASNKASYCISVGRASHWRRRGHGFKSCWSLKIFFLGFLCNCLAAKITFTSILYPQFIYNNNEFFSYSMYIISISSFLSHSTVLRCLDPCPWGGLKIWEDQEVRHWNKKLKKWIPKDRTTSLRTQDEIGLQVQ